VPPSVPCRLAPWGNCLTSPLVVTPLCNITLTWIHDMLHRHVPMAVLSLDQGLTILLSHICVLFVYVCLFYIGSINALIDWLIDWLIDICRDWKFNLSVFWLTFQLSHEQSTRSVKVFFVALRHRICTIVDRVFAERSLMLVWPNLTKLTVSDTAMTYAS